MSSETGLGAPGGEPATSATADDVAAAFAEDPGWAFILGEEYERLAPEFVSPV